MKTKRDINDYQAFYDNSPFEAEMAHFTRQHVLSEIQKFNSKRILEVGCANLPLFTEYDSEDFDLFVTVEPSLAFAQRAEKMIEFREKTLVFNDFVENITEKLVQFDFDTIILSGLLHEVEYPLHILEGVFKCCKADTKVHVNVPNAASFHRILAYEMGLIDSYTALSDNQISLQQHHTFSTKTLSELCESAGFEVLEQSSYFIKPFTHKQMAAVTENPLFAPNLLEGFSKMIKYMPDMGAHIALTLKKK